MKNEGESGCPCYDIPMTSLALIRTADIPDSERIAVLSGQLGYQATIEQIRGRLGPILADEDQLVIVAELDGAAAGWLHIFIRQTLESERQAEIAALVVDERFRGATLGRQLVARAEAWARGRGVALMRVRSRVTRERAHKFYHSLGYETVKDQRVFQKKL
jgi:GNAT superfamily N-acetyltransferase